VRLIYVRKNANIQKTVMPKISVVFYQEDAKIVPVLDWLDRLPARAQDKCRVRIERLRDLGHELRRPEADYLRDGIYELRVGLQGMNYRMLYFFHGRVAAVLAHGLVKEREVPPREIEEAIRRKRKFELDPERHTYKEG
jgi:phage-related protein